MLDLHRLGVKLGIAHRDQTIAFREQRLLLRDELGATYSQPETGEAREPKALSRNSSVGRVALGTAEERPACTIT